MPNKRNLLYLFDRPLELTYKGKGPDKAGFDIPEKYMSVRLRGNLQILASLRPKGGKRIPVRPLDSIDHRDLKVPLSFGRNEPFSLFVPRHREFATKLIDIFMGKNGFKPKLKTKCTFIHFVNEYYFFVRTYHRIEKC